MSNLEREIRFSTAVDIINKVYSDYCSDNSKTREQARRFLDFMIEMHNMHEILSKETEAEAENE